MAAPPPLQGNCISILDTCVTHQQIAILETAFALPPRQREDLIAQLSVQIGVPPSCTRAYYSYRSLAQCVPIPSAHLTWGVVMLYEKYEILDDWLHIVAGSSRRQRKPKNVKKTPASSAPFDGSEQVQQEHSNMEHPPAYPYAAPLNDPSRQRKPKIVEKPPVSSVPIDYSRQHASYSNMKSPPAYPNANAATLNDPRAIIPGSKQLAETPKFLQPPDLTETTPFLREYSAASTIRESRAYAQLTGAPVFSPRVLVPLSNQPSDASTFYWRPDFNQGTNQPTTYLPPYSEASTLSVNQTSPQFMNLPPFENSVLTLESNKLAESSTSLDLIRKTKQPTTYRPQHSVDSILNRNQANTQFTNVPTFQHSDLIRKSNQLAEAFTSHQPPVSTQPAAQNARYLPDSSAAPTSQEPAIKPNGPQTTAATPRKYYILMRKPKPQPTNAGASNFLSTQEKDANTHTLRAPGRTQETNQNRPALLKMVSLTQNQLKALISKNEMGTQTMATPTFNLPTVRQHQMFHTAASPRVTNRANKEEEKENSPPQMITLSKKLLDKVHKNQLKQNKAKPKLFRPYDL